MKFFESSKIVIKEPIKKGSNNHSVFWKFGVLKKEDIAFDEKEGWGILGCGCTNRSIDDDGIRGVYNNSSEKAETVVRNFTVYLKDENLPTIVDNPANGKRVFNSNLPKVTISFEFTVIE